MSNDKNAMMFGASSEVTAIEGRTLQVRAVLQEGVVYFNVVLEKYINRQIWPLTGLTRWPLLP